MPHRFVARSPMSIGFRTAARLPGRCRTFLCVSAALLTVVDVAGAQRPDRSIEQRSVRITRVLAVNTAPGEVTVTWPRVPDAAQYVVRRLVGGQQPQWLEVGRVDGGDSTWVDSGRPLEQPHRYSVAAVIAGREQPPVSSSLVVPRTFDAAASGAGSVDSGRQKQSSLSCDRESSFPDFAVCRSEAVKWEGPVPGTGVAAVAHCPPGFDAFGGGHLGSFPDGYVAESYPGRTSWRIVVRPRGTGTPATYPSLQALVSCRRVGK